MAMKYWEIIADKLHDAGWSLGWVATVDRKARTIWIVDAHGYRKGFIVPSRVRALKIPLEAAIGIGSEDAA